MSEEVLKEKLEQYGITPYVLQVIKLYAEGYGDKQVAAELGKGITTIGMVKMRLRERLECKTTNQMFVKLAKEGIV